MSEENAKRDSLQSQLDLLRRRVARIDQKYSTPPSHRPDQSFASRLLADGAHRVHAEEWLAGEEVQTALGRHWETCRFWERRRRHGSMDLASLAELPADLLGAVSGHTAPPCSPLRWAFLDTETTGLAGGAGTCAFLIGLGWITPEGFRLKQFFLREPAEEASALHALRAGLEPFDVLITYNGRTFDQPLLETRYRLARQKPPFARLAHLDLLYGARRLWRLRFDNCRLTELETQVLGVEREGDVPGEMIPYLYFDYLRKGEIARLAPVFHHNAIDILTLACLTAIVPWAFRSPEEARLAHGAEMIGVARWMRKAGRCEDAIAWMRQALSKPLSDALACRALWDIARMERKRGREAAAQAAYAELATFPNPHRVEALEELAKHSEHRQRDLAKAFEYVELARKERDTPALQRRAARLQQKLEQKQGPPGLFPS